MRKEKEYDETRLDEYIDRFIQYFGSPILQLRSIEPLPELKIDESQIETPKLDDVEVFLDESTELAPMELIQHETKNLKKFPLQEYRYDPKTYLQIPRERIRGAVVPGMHNGIVILITRVICALMLINEIVFRILAERPSSVWNSVLP